MTDTKAHARGEKVQLAIGDAGDLSVCSFLTPDEATRLANQLTDAVDELDGR